MNWHYNPYVLPLLLIVLVVLYLASVIRQRRSAPGAVPFALLMVSIALWATCSALKLGGGDLPTILFWANIEFIGIVLAPTFWFVFVLHYTGLGHILTRRILALLFVEPLLTQIVIWTDSFHHLFRASVSLSSAGSLLLLEPVHGPWFWLNAVYTYSLLVTSAVLLARAINRTPQLYRGQIFSLIVAVASPWMANIVYISNISPLRGLDLTPFGFTIAGLVIAWSLYRYRFLDIIPAARDMVVDGMSSAILILDPNKRVIDLNPAAAALLNLSRKDIINRPFADIVARLSLPARCLTEDRTTDQISLTQNGKTRHYNLRLTPILDRYENRTGQLIALHDITKRIEAEEAIRKQNTALQRIHDELAITQQKAEESSRLKSEFLSTLSHELRTPLNAITGYTQLQAVGALGPISDSRREYNERVLHNSRTLLNLISDVLDVSKIEAGLIEIEKQPFNIRTLAETVVAQTHSLTEQKNLKYEVSIDPQLPDMIIGDEPRLRQIMLNLISNAIKFTDEGWVRLEVKRPAANAWTITVSDSGVGIPPHAQETIFEEYQQVDSSSERKHGGTGLGLSIVRKFVLLMGGYVHLDSSVGKGSTFTVRLPLTTPEKQ